DSKDFLNGVFEFQKGDRSTRVEVHHPDATRSFGRPVGQRKTAENCGFADRERFHGFFQHLTEGYALNSITAVVGVVLFATCLLAADDEPRHNTLSDSSLSSERPKGAYRRECRDRGGGRTTIDSIRYRDRRAARGGYRRRMAAGPPSTRQHSCLRPA